MMQHCLRTARRRVAGYALLAVSIALFATGLAAQPPGADDPIEPPSIDLKGASEVAPTQPVDPSAAPDAELGGVTGTDSTGDVAGMTDFTSDQEAIVVQTDSSDQTSAGAGTATLVTYLTIFVLSVFVGFEVITKVPPTLHTPLMSGSNAISGITLVGAILAGGAANRLVSAPLVLLAVVFAAINVVGGFLVTHRMLSMFRKKG